MPSFAELIAAYESGIETIRIAVAGMTREHVMARPLAGKWTTLECVAHIADFEPIMAERMKRIISHDRPLLMVAEENLFAEKLAYDQRDLAEEMSIIETTRMQMARILKTLPKDTAGRFGIHSYRGLITLETVLTGTTNHINHHVKFIQEKREALGLK